MPAETTFTQEVADIICERIADGESLRSICQDEELPNKSTVFRWLEEQPAFATKYAHAREAQADSLFDDMLSIADNAENDWMEKHFGEDSRWVENGEVLRRSQLRISTRQWMAAKLRPKKYGEKISAELTGADGGPIEMKSVTPERRKAAIATLLARKAKD